MTVYQNLVEMRDLAKQAMDDAEAKGDTAAADKWAARYLSAKAELARYPAE